MEGHNREFEKHNRPRPNIKSSYIRMYLHGLLFAALSFSHYKLVAQYV